MFKSIIPKEFKFFDYFDKHISHMKNIASEFQSLASGKVDISYCARMIKENEIELNKITQSCISALYKTFVTPFEKIDIIELITKMDDIADNMDLTVERIKMFSITSLRPEIKTIADLISQALNELGDAIYLLRDENNFVKIREKCLAVQALEDECDAVYHTAIVNLFREGDHFMSMKWKEVLERLELSIEQCRLVANVIQSVSLEPEYSR